MVKPAFELPITARDGALRFDAALTLLRDAIEARVTPGASFGVLYRGEVLALEAAGRLTYEPESPEVCPATIYDLASLTKVVATTTATMQLYERGLLDLDWPVGKLLPGFVADCPATSDRHRVTLRMLLAHCSGLPGYARLFEQNHDRAAMLHATERLTLTARPGERAEYSDPGFILLGRIVEVLTDQPLDRYCADQIFTPLGLSSLVFCPPAAWREQIPPTEIDASFRHRLIQGEVQDENCAAMGGVSGHAGLFGHAYDLLRFASLFLGTNEHHEAEQAAAAQPPLPATGQNPLGLTQKTIDLFTTQQRSPTETTRALGWDTPSVPHSSSGHFFGRKSFGHLGYAGTSLWIDPEQELAIVLLTNRTWPDRSNKQIQQLRPAFHDATVQSLG